MYIYQEKAAAAVDENAPFHGGKSVWDINGALLEEAAAYEL